MSCWLRLRLLSKVNNKGLSIEGKNQKSKCKTKELKKYITMSEKKSYINVSIGIERELEHEPDEDG